MCEAKIRKDTIKKLMETLFKECPVFKMEFESASIIGTGDYNPMIRSFFYSDLAGKITKSFINTNDHRIVFNNFVITHREAFYSQEMKEIKAIMEACKCSSKIHSEHLLKTIVTELFYDKLLE